ncbi:hypothetical protein ACFV08_01250 [Streptomyces fradiae]|uniref:Uncharacterized protein n=1 Tax=Streptomyces rubrolavendulae TaxID=285473 RepID=A0A1D8GB08_9ACTN|nr:hypothetical protein A4G23_05526 [Streptomyces rubrolavendulae]
MQLAVLPWDALETRSWPGIADTSPPKITRVLGTYARRVTTPRGSTAVTGLELTTALRPPPGPCRTRRPASGCPATTPAACEPNRPESS